MSITDSQAMHGRRICIMNGGKVVQIRRPLGCVVRPTFVAGFLGISALQLDDAAAVVARVARRWRRSRPGANSAELFGIGGGRAHRQRRAAAAAGRPRDRRRPNPACGASPGRLCCAADDNASVTSAAAFDRRPYSARLRASRRGVEGMAANPPVLTVAAFRAARGSSPPAEQWSGRPGSRRRRSTTIGRSRADALLNR
jgi:hypothetical protein